MFLVFVFGTAMLASSVSAYILLTLTIMVATGSPNSSYEVRTILIIIIRYTVLWLRWRLVDYLTGEMRCIGMAIIHPGGLQVGSPYTEESLTSEEI